jgi:hypothetical protein
MTGEFVHGEIFYLNQDETTPATDKKHATGGYSNLVTAGHTMKVHNARLQYVPLKGEGRAAALANLLCNRPMTGHQLALTTTAVSAAPRR